MIFIKMPKIELHCHLDGSVRPETILDISQKQGLKLPSYEISELKNMLTVPKDCDSLVEYLKCFSLPGMVMQNKQNLKRISYELFEDAASENIKYMEVRFAPLLHINEGLSIKEVVSSVLEGIRLAESKYEIRGNIILSCMRTMDAQKCLEVVESGREFLGKGVVAVDLCANEDPGFANQFVEAINKASQYGYEVTIHAGETGVGENVYDAITLLNATRIGHGIFIKDCPKAYALVKERGVALEVCPTSNVQTNAVDSYEDHPVCDFLKDGIEITMNTDNRTVSNTTLSNEFVQIENTFGLDSGHAQSIYETSIRHSFADLKTKGWLKSFIEDFQQIETSI